MRSPRCLRGARNITPIYADSGNPVLLVTKQEGENFIHKTLWSVVDRQIENAKTQERGSFFDLIAAMVFVLLSFEAYLNFLGERLAPEIWKNERDFFRREPYRGFDGRVRKIFELCQTNELDRDKRPYATVWELKQLRDLIAHGKIEKVLREFNHSQGTEPPFMRVTLYELVTLDKAYQARDDIYDIARILHTAAIDLQKAAKPPVNDPWFGNDPFGGARGYMVGSTTATSQHQQP